MREQCFVPRVWGKNSVRKSSGKSCPKGKWYGFHEDVDRTVRSYIVTWEFGDGGVGSVHLVLEVVARVGVGNGWVCRGCVGWRRRRWR